MLLDVQRPCKSLLASHIRFPNKANGHLSFKSLSLHSLSSSLRFLWVSCLAGPISAHCLARGPVQTVPIFSVTCCVPLMYSFLILSLCITQHFHHLPAPALLPVFEPAAFDAPLLRTVTETFLRTFEPACTSSFTSFPPTLVFRPPGAQ